MEKLVADIEAFLDRNPQVSATRFGADALGDRHLVRQLRAGRRLWPETEQKVRSFMERADHDAGCAARGGGASSGTSAEISHSARAA